MTSLLLLMLSVISSYIRPPTLCAPACMQAGFAWNVLMWASCNWVSPDHCILQFPATDYISVAPLHISEVEATVVQFNMVFWCCAQWWILKECAVYVGLFFMEYETVYSVLGNFCLAAFHFTAITNKLLRLRR
jgi:hypothetical protein